MYNVNWHQLIGRSKVRHTEIAQKYIRHNLMTYFHWDSLSYDQIWVQLSIPSHEVQRVTMENKTYEACQNPNWGKTIENGKVLIHVEVIVKYKLWTFYCCMALQTEPPLYIILARRSEAGNVCFGTVTFWTYQPSWLVRILSDVIVIQMIGL